MALFADGKTVSAHNKDDGVGVPNIKIFGDEKFTPFKNAFKKILERMLGIGKQEEGGEPRWARRIAGAAARRAARPSKVPRK